MTIPGLIDYSPGLAAVPEAAFVVNLGDPRARTVGRLWIRWMRRICNSISKAYD